MENQAEALKIRMPLKVRLENYCVRVVSRKCPLQAKDVEIRSEVKGCLERLCKRNPFKLTNKNIPDEPHKFTAVYDRRYMDQ